MLNAAAIVAATTDKNSDSPTLAERYVVTGSYLPDAAAVNASPVATLNRGEIEGSGASDPLRLLKSLTPYFSGSGNAGNEVDLLGVGESYLALRNLPTLVLLDGRRLASSPFSANNSPAVVPAVDLSTIPAAMIDHIDILKDSASTIYGSDAIGGVVNIVLRQNFQGGDVNLRYGTDRHGDYWNKEASAVAGVSRSGTSVTVGVSWFKSPKLSTLSRDLATLTPTQLVALGQNPAVLSSQISGSYPGRVANDLVAGSPLAVGAAGYNAGIATPPPKTDPTAPPQTLAQLVAAGYYVPISDTAASKAAGGSATILNTALYGFALIVPNERKQAIATFRQELAGSRLEAFGNLLFSRTVNGGSDLAPGPLSGVAASRLTIPANNPYNLFGVAIGVGGVPNAPGVVTRLDDLGNRSTDNTVDTFRGVAGLRGDLADGWHWESALEYARAAGTEIWHGEGSAGVLNQLLIPELDASGAHYVYDAQGRPLSVYVRNGKNVPVFNYFGIEGTNAPETIDALRATLRRDAQIDQTGWDVRTNGRLIALPAGDLTAAVGGEIRRESTSSSADPIFNAGQALSLIPFSNLPAHSRSTRAAFAEIHLPLSAPAQSVPMVRRLDLTAAARYEDISPGGSASTPKLGLRWVPFTDDWLVRATYSKGFVAPSIFALYGPPQGSAPSVTIPEGNGQTGSGGATGRIVSGQFIRQVIENSNPALTPARSESYTVGVVYSPHQIKGLNLSADYYHIKQDKMGGFDYTYIVGDLNARGSASPYAANFRFTDGTTLTTTAPNQVTSTNAGALSVVYNPVGDMWTDGVDLSSEYTHAAGSGTLALGAQANVLFNFMARTNPSAAYLQYARNFTEPLTGHGNAQGVLPSYVIRGHLDYEIGGAHGGLRFNYLPSVVDAGTAFGAPSGSPNVFRANLKPYTIPNYATVDVVFEYRLSEAEGRFWSGVHVGVGVNNLFDRQPPFVSGAGSGVSFESNTVKSTYDVVGRFVFAEIGKRF